MNVVIVAQWPYQLICCDHIGSINLAILAGGIYWFVSGKTEQAGIRRWLAEGGLQNINFIVGLVFPLDTSMFDFLFPINSGYDPPSFSPLQISHIDTDAMMDHF